MKFSEIVEQAKTLLQRKERISYRALKMEFDLDDEQLDILKEELIDIEELAIDKDGKMLVWIGQGIKGETDKGINGNPEGEKAKRAKGESEVVSFQSSV